jgi:hypothetical protein
MAFHGAAHLLAHLATGPFSNKRVSNMTVDSSVRRSVLFSQDIECPVCETIAHSFRILPGNTFGAPAGEFYHGAAVCAGAILADTPAALTLQRLRARGIASGHRPISRNNSRFYGTTAVRLGVEASSRSLSTKAGAFILGGVLQSKRCSSRPAEKRDWVSSLPEFRQ